MLLEDTICSGTAVAVQANNPCAPEWLDATVTWDWDYDNGPETVAPNNLAPVTHVFTNLTYFDQVRLIGLTVSNICGEDTTIRPLVVIADSIAANFTASPDSGCAPLEVAIVQSGLGATEWQWAYDAPNGVFSSGFSPTHVYVEPGQYVARLVVGNGCVTDTLDRLITAYPPAVVEAFALPDTVCEGVLVEFTSTSVNSNGWTWDFDDAGSGATGPTAEHVFNNSGTYDVSLVVNDISTGCGGRDTVQVEVVESPEAILNVTPQSDCPPLEVVMESGSLNANTIQWQVIEGTTEVFSFDPEFTYTYTLPGSHPIRLIALNASGCSDTTRVEVEVFPPVDADFTFTPDSSCITPVSVSFAHQGSGVGPLQYTWNLGGPPAGPSTATAERTYADPGSYTVCLSIASQDGCVDDTCKVLTVLPTPEAVMEVPATICLGDVMDLINNSVNTTGQNWSFGNGALSSLFEPDYTYPDTGIYLVRLDVVGASGCVDSALAVVTVCGVPTAGFVAEQIIANRYRFMDRSVDASSYTWDFGDGRTSDEREPEHTFAPDPNTCSWVVVQEVFNTCGCSSTADTTLRAPAEALIFVANSFSPNGDGDNDTFAPDFPLQFVPDLREAGWRFRIYSRWGSEVFFDTDDPSKEWDGRVNGSEVPPDVYQWTLDLNLDCIPDAEPFLRGHVTLWR
ncbi:MAG: PKD domain-containing protein [Flavobacteriales bacterium]|nr:PKD domain-containing protein [Flavobacteriales bacterium]